MHHDLEKELEHVRKEGEEHRRLLNQESAKAKEAASAARAEAARMRNEAEFERGRSQHLQDQLRELHKQMEDVAQNNTKYQVHLWHCLWGLLNPNILQYHKGKHVIQCSSYANLWPHRTLV